MIENKKFYCKECGYQFPPELVELIKKKVIVYCEKCGTPFSMEGISLKKDYFKYIREKERRKQYINKFTPPLEKIIQFLNKISFIPVLILTIVAFSMIGTIVLFPKEWVAILIKQFCLGFSSLFITIYDMKYLSKKIENKEYDSILLDSFLWGIAGCILFGTGVIILIKGLLIIFYNILKISNKENSTYQFGLLSLKSLNRSSALLGFEFIIISLFFLAQDIYYEEGVLILPELIPLIGFGIISIIALIIDYSGGKKFKPEKNLKISSFFKFLILGILGSLFFGVGALIIIKSILILLMAIIFGSNKILSDKKEIPLKSKTEIDIIPRRELRIPDLSNKKDGSLAEREEIKEIEKSKIQQEEKNINKQIQEVKLKINESLLPVKDDKDKKVIKQYFTRIFTILSKDIRQKINELKIPKKEKKMIMKELAFLTAEEQAKYMTYIINIYGTEIPEKLIDRVKKLPNLKPKYYEQIIEQLKSMDPEERIRFIEFLEKYSN